MRDDEAIQEAETQDKREARKCLSFDLFLNSFLLDFRIFIISEKNGLFLITKNFSLLAKTYFLE